MRRGRPILGLISGLFWGLGTVVLINMYGLSTLNPQLLYGVTGGAVMLSWVWSRRGRRVAGTQLLAAALLLPAVLAAQDDRCLVRVDPGDRELNSTSLSEPLVIDPDNRDRITVVIRSPVELEDHHAEIWVEVGGVTVPLRTGSLSGSEFAQRFDPDELLTPFGVLPGLHHVGGTIEGVCEVDGYIRVLGNPLANPVGQAAIALVVIGLGGTWLAGRSPSPAPADTAAPEPAIEPPQRPPPTSPEPPPSEPEPPPREEPTTDKPPLALVDARWLQARIFAEPDHNPMAYFLPDTTHDIEVRIGPHELGWMTGTTPFPDDRLPGGGPHRLTVLLTEPYLLHAPQISRILLPEHGASTSAWFELTTRAGTSRVDARLTVLYGNRVLHTARLPHQVGTGTSAADASRLTADNVAEVETVVQGVGGLAGSQPFDAAFVVNHDGRGVGRITEISDGGAREVNLDEDEIANAIRLVTTRLREIVEQPADFDGIDTQGTRELLIYLARHGTMLRQALVGEFLDTLAGAARLQVISARSDAYFPFEFAYDFDSPRQEPVEICSSGRRMLADSRTDVVCPGPHGPSIVCPMGFWGLAKTIERHTFREHAGHNPRFLVRSQPVAGRDRIKLGAGSIFAASDRVDSFAPGSISRLAATMAAVSAGHSLRADTWDQWSADVTARRPSLLVLLPHTIFDDNNSLFGLEIGDHDRRLADEIDEHFIPPEDRPVIVALLGCETATAGPLSYERFPRRFREAGAEIVVGTITEVLGRHAAPIAERLVTVLHERVAEGTSSLGEVIVVLRRRLLSEGIPAVLGVTAFGDAAWLIEA